jgi:peptide/nickel transport system substrate-binding protein
MEGDFAFRKTAEILQAQLTELDIQLNITELAWPTMWEQIGSLETAPDIVPLRNYPDFADSSSLYSSMLASSAWGSNGWNISYYGNERLDELLEAVNQTTDEAERSHILQEMAQIVVDDAPMIFLGTYVNQVAMRDNVKGYVFNPIYTPVMNLYEMYKE